LPSIFRCICGIDLQVYPGLNKAMCPFCGTSWEPTIVKLFNGVTYDIQDNGRWVARSKISDQEPSWKPVPFIFGDDL
jgi:hypothetical protein